LKTIRLRSFFAWPVSGLSRLSVSCDIASSCPQDARMPAGVHQHIFANVRETTSRRA
jgi:hypothetical protein